MNEKKRKEKILDGFIYSERIFFILLSILSIFFFLFYLLYFFERFISSDEFIHSFIFSPYFFFVLPNESFLISCFVSKFCFFFQYFFLSPYSSIINHRHHHHHHHCGTFMFFLNKMFSNGMKNFS